MRRVFVSTALFYVFALFSTVFATLFPTGAFAQGDVGAAQEAICCAAECCGIGGACLRRGDVNPANACQTCNPDMSQTAFTTTPGCGGTDAGMTTDDGGCSVSVSASHTAAPFVFIGLVATALLVRRRRR